MIRALALTLALGLIVVPVSEMMFWPVAPTAPFGLLVFYGPCALLAAWVVERAGARGWSAVVLAGGIFGWLIEGVVVAETYEVVPFSLIWTPLAWHMLFSVLGAGVGLRLALTGPRWRAVAVPVLIGGLAGLWGGYAWTILIADMAAGPAVMTFPLQITLAAAMLAAGHLILDHLPRGLPMPGWIGWILGVLALAVWAAAWALPLFPVSLSVPLLIGLSAWAVRRQGAGADAIDFGRIPPWRYAVFALIPAVAVPVQAALVSARPVWLSELNVWVALPSVAAGGLAWAAAMLVAWRRPSRIA